MRAHVPAMSTARAEVSTCIAVMLPPLAIMCAKPCPRVCAGSTDSAHRCRAGWATRATATVGRAPRTEPVSPACATTTTAATRPSATRCEKWEPRSSTSVSAEAATLAPAAAARSG